MTQHAHGTREPHSHYDDMPFSLLLFRYLWPFWLFRDAGNGDRFSRAAAYRHNRNMRVHLPGYLLKWVCSCLLALSSTIALGSLSAQRPGTLDIYGIMAAGSGMLFACATCILFVTAYIYLYLSRNDC
ncbi:MAG TPA: hypothetical protein VGN07_18550 [Steroidobacteraceae bacterium]|jgi:hypothetical protein